MCQVVTGAVVCAVFAVEAHVGRAVGGAAVRATSGQVGDHVHNARRHQVKETVPENGKNN